MALYFIVSSKDNLDPLILGLGAKVGWDGIPNREIDVWQQHTGISGINVRVPIVEAGPALTTGVIDIYVTTQLSVAMRIAGSMPTALVYDENGGLYHADEGPAQPTDPVVDAYPVEAIIRVGENIDSATQLSGATIALVAGTGIELSTAKFFEAMGLEYTPVVFVTSMEAIRAFADGRADALVVSDGAGVGIANQYLGGAHLYDIIDLAGTSQGPAPDHVRNVALLYEAGLARAADIGGLNYWIDRHETGMDLVSMAAHFLDSAEFTQRFGDDDAMSASQFVNQLYRNVLDRSGEVAGVEYWIGRMNAGATREIVLREFSASPENVASSTVGLLTEIAPGYWSFG